MGGVLVETLFDVLSSSALFHFSLKNSRKQKNKVHFKNWEKMTSCSSNQRKKRRNEDTVRWLKGVVPTSISSKNKKEMKKLTSGRSLKNLWSQK